MISTIDRYKGCLFGLAIGDALGAPVEFLALKSIRLQFGRDGIADFQKWNGFEPGSFADDTQMSLATAEGCIRAWQRWSDRGISHAPSVVYRRYLEWARSQVEPHQRRCPGTTCLTALRSGQFGTISKPINNSKGCGGVMRVAVVGLAFPSRKAFRSGAEFAALTHGHPSGYLPAGFLAELVSHVIEGRDLEEALDSTVATLTKFEGHEETLQAVAHARTLALRPTPAVESIEDIGGGWVGEEALAIAIYCSSRFRSDWTQGTLAAVNHPGDSDSTGSITGAILGTLLGLGAIPDHWVKDVEDSARIAKIADDMFRAFQNGEKLPFEEYPPN